MYEEAFSFFDNQPKLLSPQMVSDLLHSSRLTVYDWKYRPSTYEVPDDLFLKVGRRLLIRTDILKKWLITRAKQAE